MSEEGEVRHVFASDSGRGADGGPQTPAAPAAQAEAHDHNYQVSRAITLGLDWQTISPAFIKHGECVLKLAEELRRAGFSAAWVQETIQVGDGNGMLDGMFHLQR